jgi:uncharacterized protein YecT (DUF1311 family)
MKQQQIEDINFILRSWSKDLDDLEKQLAFLIKSQRGWIEHFQKTHKSQGKIKI